MCSVSTGTKNSNTVLATWSVQSKQICSVENMNGYVRSFLPFGITLLEITQEQLDHIANTINTIPRSFLKYQTPKEVLNTYKMKESRVKLAVPAMKAEVNKSFNMNSLNVALHAWLGIELVLCPRLFGTIWHVYEIS